LLLILPNSTRRWRPLGAAAVANISINNHGQAITNGPQTLEFSMWLTVSHYEKLVMSQNTIKGTMLELNSLTNKHNCILAPKNKQKFHKRLHNMSSLAEDYWDHYIKVNMINRKSNMHTKEMHTKQWWPKSLRKTELTQHKHK